MDKLLYISMSGAKENLNATALRANNLANAKTTGFKSDIEQARSMQAFGEGMPTRVFSLTERPAQDFTSGPLISTSRDLDVAVQGEGWLVVQAEDGSQALSRAGSLQIDNAGMLRNAAGQFIMGDGGPIALPIPVDELNIGSDGTITVRPQGAPATVIEEVGRLQLVNPERQNLVKGNDGLFRLKDGGEFVNDAEVTIASGMLEGSNVNSVSEMVDLISLQRQFDMQVKMMKTAEEVDTSQDRLLRLG
ncbi:flagellar basal body rod protein FlgF [Psychrobium sp. 1_MG-2023]|uniref:flagellar basal body rod protein FlgF n=1 Tax=Psychrobium sp. 1_MG-2023 TaxID=3062624 RepID=UPI000C34C4B6|nr:flagellar basal body rod protein FlgF [Psychrobium sp. 1_MG-2023]MDP2559869.1 flagellar basal body rod protein FlgF [Psychrobium sp. 1_MG-2023]PKF59030.1 flagellar biosynthesis protein FlgF [Alteromonadales bacterium alter-6D02]